MANLSSDNLVLRATPAPDVVCLTLNRPEKRNAISEQMRLDLIEALNDPETARCRAVILCGAGNAFSAGADLVETVNVPSQRRLQSWDRLMQTLANMPMPVITAVEGLAFGAGFELALTCDIIVASQDARFALPEVSYGFLPGCGGTQRLVRAIGKHRAMAVILTAQTLDAPEALAHGIASCLCAPGTARDTAISMAAKIAGFPEMAVNSTRRAIAQGMDLPLADGLKLEREMLLPLLDTLELRDRAGRFKETKTSNAE